MSYSYRHNKNCLGKSYPQAKISASPIVANATIGSAGASNTQPEAYLYPGVVPGIGTYLGPGIEGQVISLHRPGPCWEKSTAIFPGAAVQLLP